MITGKALIEMGYSPSPWFAAAIAAARDAAARGDDIRDAIQPKIEYRFPCPAVDRGGVTGSGGAIIVTGLTGERTSAALAQAKRRGVKLGNPRLSEVAGKGWSLRRLRKAVR
jgi:hypothetical protein